MDSIISHKMKETKEQVMTKLDQEVAEKLRDRNTQSSIALDKSKKFAWDLLKNELSDHAIFDDSRHTFDLQSSPLA